MALKAVAAYFWEPHPSQCLSGCEESDYQGLIVTKCCHVFCEACIELSVKKKPKCPNCRDPIPPEQLEKLREESSSFKFCFDKFTYYLRHDFAKLKKIAKIEKVVLKTFSYHTLERKKDTDDSSCSVCLAVPIPLHLYYIIEDKELSKIGRYMHENCLESKVDNDSRILDIEVNDFVKVAGKLPWPPKQPDTQPTEPASPIKIFFLAIILPMSIWALAMNSRIYNNKSAVLFVLSIPALIILQIFSLLLYGLKAVFKDKHA